MTYRRLATVSIAVAFVLLGVDCGGRTALNYNDGLGATPGTLTASGVGGTATVTTGFNGASSSGGSTPADQDASAPSTTCPILAPYLKTYYLGDPDFPCPSELQPTPDSPPDSCPNASAGNVQCVYPAFDVQGVETICKCYGYGTGWGFMGCDDIYCKRSGDTCLAGAGSSGPLIQLSGSCADRQSTTCDTGTDLTAQGVLDEAVGKIFSNCGSERWLGGILTVYFKRGCATSFVFSMAVPTYGSASVDLSADGWAATCVKQQLEAANPNCAADFECGTVVVEGIPLMCGG